MTASTHGHIQYINPDDLPKNPAFTNVIVVTGPAKTIYIGGQDAVDASGTIIGKGNKQQTEQVLINLQAALKAGGAELEHIVKWNVCIVQGQPLEPGFEAFQRIWGRRPNPPVITVVFVSGLANPDFLVEMDPLLLSLSRNQAKSVFSSIGQKTMDMENKRQKRPRYPMLA